MTDTEADITATLNGLNGSNIASIEDQQRDVLDLFALPDWRTYPHNRARRRVVATPRG